MLAALVITGAFFIFWDVIFTRQGVWGFNSTYLTGLTVINLPIEEWLFFVTVPIACTFIYEVLNYFVPNDVLKEYAYPFTKVLIGLLIILGITFYDRSYTFITSILTAIFLIFLIVKIKPPWLGRFYLAFLVTFIPFFLVNGILTGSFIPDEVVWYNNQENLTIRLFTIPVEDIIYNLLMLSMFITIYESWKRKNNMTTF